VSDLAVKVQELLDRQAILDCLHRINRGVDRDDVELVASCYHPEALDDHGFYVGSGPGMAEWAIAGHAESRTSQHHITNHLVDLDGDGAHSETYFLAVNHQASGAITVACGRYMDRFERRNGEWRIAGRVCIVETVIDAQAGDLDAISRSFAPFTRDRTDLSYQRPLTVARTSATAEHPPLA
jgi:SnoaL-like domain